MIELLNHHVLVVYEDITEVDPLFKRAKEWGLQLPKEIEEMQRRNAGVDKGIVAGLGPTAFEDTPDNKPKIGERVGFRKHSGKIVQDEMTEEKYILLTDEDIHYIQR